MNTMLRRLGAAGAALFLAATSAVASNYTVNWLSFAPTPFGSAPPANGSYNLPGIGTVGVSYTVDVDFATGRLQVPQLATGSVSYSGDNYGWANQETLARTLLNPSTINKSWSVTYTFPGTVPAGQIILGVQGLGRRDPLPGENPADTISTATVLQNGTFLGEYTGALNVGPTDFQGGPGIFTMRNSLTGPGGADPWWNTGLALVRIDDATNSLTVRFAHTSGDGVGVNIGTIVPEPASAGLLLAAGLLALRRRR